MSFKERNRKRRKLHLFQNLLWVRGTHKRVFLSYKTPLQRLEGRDKRHPRKERSRRQLLQKSKEKKGRLDLCTFLLSRIPHVISCILITLTEKQEKNSRTTNSKRDSDEERERESERKKMRQQDNRIKKQWDRKRDETERDTRDNRKEGQGRQSCIQSLSLPRLYDSTLIPSGKSFFVFHPILS